MLIICFVLYSYTEDLSQQQVESCTIVCHSELTKLSINLADRISKMAIAILYIISKNKSFRQTGSQQIVHDHCDGVMTGTLFRIGKKFPPKILTSSAANLSVGAFFYVRKPFFPTHLKTGRKMEALVWRIFSEGWGGGSGKTIEN